MPSSRRGGVPQRVVPLASGKQLTDDAVGVLVLLDQLVHLRVGDLTDHLEPDR